MAEHSSMPRPLIANVIVIKNFIVNEVFSDSGLSKRPLEASIPRIDRLHQSSKISSSIRFIVFDDSFHKVKRLPFDLKNVRMCIKTLKKEGVSFTAIHGRNNINTLNLE